MNRRHAIGATLLSALVPSVAEADGPPATAHYILQKTESERPLAIAVLVPGASGLQVFGDSTHYSSLATRLTRLGYHALLVDYKSAYRALTTPPAGSTASKIAWIIEDALAGVRDKGERFADLPVVIFAWSLGAEGAIELLGDPRRLERNKIRGSILYYPSSKDATKATFLRPTLAMFGDLDTVTPVEQLISKIEPASSNLRLVRLEGAHHGFDIRSLVVPQKVREFPFFGKEHTFQYHEMSAERAEESWMLFLVSSLSLNVR